MTVAHTLSSNLISLHATNKWRCEPIPWWM